MKQRATGNMQATFYKMLTAHYFLVLLFDR